MPWANHGLSIALRRRQRHLFPQARIYQRVRERLCEVYDPELPLNIVDLGLIYATESSEIGPEQYRVEIEMTLTTPQCGMGKMIARDIEKSVRELPEVSEVETRVVWEPEWTPHKISAEGRAKLGID